MEAAEPEPEVAALREAIGVALGEMEREALELGVEDVIGEIEAAALPEPLGDAEGEAPPSARERPCAESGEAGRTQQTSRASRRTSTCILANERHKAGKAFR